MIRLVFPLSVVASAPHPPWPCLTAARRVSRRWEHHVSTVFAWSTFGDLSFSAAFWGQLCKSAMSPDTVGGWLLWLVLCYEMWRTCHHHYLYASLLDGKELFWDVPLTKRESNENSEKIMWGTKLFQLTAFRPVFQRYYFRLNYLHQGGYVPPTVYLSAHLFVCG